jgi:acetylornithine deacetylase
MSQLPAPERTLLETGFRWIDENADTLVALLEDLVARPSVTGSEGTRDRPDTTVGRLWDALDEHTDDAVLDAQPIPPEAEADYVDDPRENVYATLNGAEEASGGFVAQSHTDVVPPGSSAAWPNGEPFAVSHGTVRRTGRTRIELDVNGNTYERQIRENLATVWDRRDADSFDVLVGRGVYDNKACSVCLVGCLAALERALDREGVELGGDVVHAHLVDEEKAQLGIKNMVGWRDRADWLGDRYDRVEDFAAVVLEGQYGFVPVVGHRGGINVTIDAHGDAVHGSTPKLGRNAVLGTAKALARMDTDAFADAVTEPFVDDELLGAFTVALGTTIAGGGIERVDPSTGTVERSGGAEYAVSDWCQATVDCRIPRWAGFPDDPDAVHDRFLELLREQIGAAAPDIEFDVESNMFFLPVAIGDDREAAREHPLVKTATESTREVCGYEPDLAVAPGATDAWVLYHATHVPTLVEYGPAGALSHEPLEYVERQQVIDGAKTLLDLTVRQVGVA